MNRRRRAAAPASAVFLAVALTLLAGIAAASTYQFYDGVTDPPPNYPATGSGINIFANSWGAQSFRASENYTIARVDLWAIENGAGNLSAVLELRADNAGSPNMLVPPLATAATTAASSYGWVSFNLAPNVLLARGTTYWVVLENNGTGGSRGWTWWNTDNETSLPNGTGETSADLGSSWDPAQGDFALRTYGYVETRIQAAMVVPSAQVRAGDVVTYTVFFNNTGGVPAAQVWINDTLPAGLTYASDNATASNGVRTGDARWVFEDVQPGLHFFLVAARVDDGFANQSMLVNRVNLAYTDFRGAAMPNSTAVITVTVTGVLAGGDNPYGMLPYFLFAAVFGWILLVGLWPRGKLEQVFLVDNGGTLVAHLTPSRDERFDQDIFVGMLTAVQAFVRDSFGAAKEGGLKRMDFGPRKIYLCRGTHTYLAAVLKGRTPPTLGRKMRRTLDRIEGAYGEILANWSGDTRQVAGTTELLMAGLLS